MKTKLLAFLLALVMVVLALASCGPTGPADDTCPPHADDDSDGICDKCQEKMPENKPVTPGDDDNDGEYVLPEITWKSSDPVELLFSMSDNSNRDELSSGCRRYLAGDSNSGGVTQMAKQRNRDAEDYANVHITYTYYEEGTVWTWGNCVTNTDNNQGIYQKANMMDEKGRPDMFVNFVYDMVSASLLGCFNNLYTNKVTSTGISGINSTDLQNYFAFAKDGRYDTTYTDEANNNEGYMITYMQSLTLSEEKMYLVASDYFTDLVRAFFVVPVNVARIEEMDASEDPESFFYDYVDDGKYTIADFYELVKAGRWTYEAVKEFSEKMYSEPTDPDEVLSGKWGFALASGGLGGSGILYTTSITIIQRNETQGVVGTDEFENDIIGQVYEFYYPDNSDVLNKFITELGSLFASQGVTHVQNKANEGVVNSTYDGTKEQAVRDYFAAGNVGFGGIICVGSLEEPEYAAMGQNGGKGFGVAPVPLYQDTRYDEELGTYVPEQYLTQIHNVGRVGAIGIKTTKFAACTAFLNYQSLNSTDILNAYYDIELCGGIAGGVSGTDYILQEIIRKNVRSSFDKAFEDAVARQALIGESKDDTLSKNKWHNIIITNNFSVEVSAMKTYYDTYVKMKDTALTELEESYKDLP